jgi:predicted MFS family arabinose efflux permease
MTIFRCENWSAVFWAAVLFSIPAFVVWRTVSDGRLSLRRPLRAPSETYDTKRNPKKFRIYLAAYAFLTGGIAVLLVQQISERCGGS